MVSETLHEFERIIVDTTAGPLDHQKFQTLLTKLFDCKDDQCYIEGMSALRDRYECLSSNQTLQGRAFIKAYGYPGDFEIIDKIYTNHISTDNRFKKWDEYFQLQKAPVAVRNRKGYFIKFLENIDKEKRPKKILNLASGPCRDIKEFYEKNPNSKLTFECVELDKRAIKYAKDLLGRFEKNVTFYNQNVFRFRSTKAYDVIWSAGLFDYFEDKTFKKILSKFLISSPKAKIVIGNFSNENPTTPYMEVIGEWYLHYRSPDGLRDIAIGAGANPNSVSIESEPEKVNLFLKIN